MILSDPPDILLTNYVMMELILTRHRDRGLVRALGGLRFLVLDELHSYRGRQGADVGLLVRRVREAAGSDTLRCVGTSATLSTEGGHDERRSRLAEVGSALFGAEVRPDDVIEETLRRVTPERDKAHPAFASDLTEAASNPQPPGDFERFRNDALASWIETEFGVCMEQDRLVRATPLSLVDASERLASLSGIDREDCERALAAYLKAGGEIVDPVRGNPVFAFRLHQFISRGDTVYATPESPSGRALTLDRRRFVSGDRSRVFLPLAFCRTCGQDYYVVNRLPPDETGEGSLVTRDLGDTSDDRVHPGFLYLNDDRPWPDDLDEALKRLPLDWLDGTGRLRANRRQAVPTRVEVRSDGTLVSSEDGEAGSVTGWWTPAPFRFCMACRVSHIVRKGSRDFSRLATLGTEGRSTATTTMSLAAIQHLRKDGRLPPEARKLLSFTDNRQDASLQAGHFNDFVQVTQLRSALWRALDRRPEGLRHDELPQAVFGELALPREHYALDPDLRGWAASNTDDALRDVIAYRLYRDLQRGWRLTQPNLEQTGLLVIEYESLAALARDEAVWSDCHPALVKAGPERRRHVLTVLLDWIRRELGLRVNVLDPRRQDSLKLRADQRLTGPWSVADERLVYATEVLTRPRQRHDNRAWRHVSGRGGFGQFLRRPDGLASASPRRLTMNDTTGIISQMAERLRRYGLLIKVGGDKATGLRWQIPAAALIWRAGAGQRPYRDHIRMPNDPADLPPNEYFVHLYRNAGPELAGIEAREHTAQVPYEERIEREWRFRKAELPVLYCSPTMELGVDISQLNVVNMRNVPPTPANYAQRSGRAGRSGQAALVFTYCSVGSSHDQHFFRHQEQMISGQVEAPRVDLANEDLVRAHVHAIWLAESGLDLRQSMGDILELADGVIRPKILDSIRAHLDDPHSRSRTLVRARTILHELVPMLSEASWWSPTWLEEALGQIPRRFEKALERWLSLYAAALAQARRQSEIAVSATRSPEDIRQARILRRQAENQLAILRATSDARGQSDFYTYRYFASEGFLPGYSFPRLPLSAFIPGRRGRFSDGGEYLQRPRFLAISEFGPQTYLYHEGARYRINKVILDPETDGAGTSSPDGGGLITQSVKRCEECGYLHRIDQPPGPDMCERCGVALGTAWNNLLRMRNVDTVRKDRITSDEEERLRVGYEVISGIEFAPATGTSRVTKRRVMGLPGPSDEGLRPLFTISYGDTATIWRMNLGWRRRKLKERRGFILDVERGYWGKRDDSDDPDDPLSPRTRRVIPYVTDTRNALLIEPDADLDEARMASLAAALKAAFEVVFQLESSEIASEPLPSRDDRRVLLFYESAEGGAGALRRLSHEPDLWRRIARQALRRCHLDPDTLAASDGSAEQEPCEGACYMCLMTYRNQLDHQLLDRDRIADLLAGLRHAELESMPDEQPLPTESSLEEAFMTRLEKGGFRLPDRSQVLFSSASTRPDFVYDDACAVIYVDGPVHDYPERAARDRRADQAMRNLGYRVLRFGHRDNWDIMISENRSVFGPGDEQR